MMSNKHTSHMTYRQPESRWGSKSHFTLILIYKHNPCMLSVVCLPNQDDCGFCQHLVNFVTITLWYKGRGKEIFKIWNKFGQQLNYVLLIKSLIFIAKRHWQRSNEKCNIDFTKGRVNSYFLELCIHQLFLPTS